MTETSFCFWIIKICLSLLNPRNAAEKALKKSSLWKGNFRAFCYFRSCFAGEKDFESYIGFRMRTLLISIHQCILDGRSDI